jgi:predicted Zn-ribbon and HTH transcriptional regulator
VKGWDAKQPDGLPEGAAGCPTCGALPCDWVNAPTDVRRETLNEVVDALYRIMPNSDGYEAKAFVAELLEEVLSQNPLEVTPARHCDDCGFSTHEQDVAVCPDPRCRGSVG